MILRSQLDLIFWASANMAIGVVGLAIGGWNAVMAIANIAVAADAINTALDWRAIALAEKEEGR